MRFVIEHPEPRHRKGMPDARYVSYAHGRDDTPGYLWFTHVLWKAKTWKTRRGVERYLENRPNLIKAGYEITEIE